jgi:hypothetical protein
MSRGPYRARRTPSYYTEKWENFGGWGRDVTQPISVFKVIIFFHLLNYLIKVQGDMYINIASEKKMKGLITAKLYLWFH